MYLFGFDSGCIIWMDFLIYISSNIYQLHLHLKEIN